MATVELEPITRTRRTPAEIDVGLAAVALCGGNCSRAAQQLEEAGTPIPKRTLQDWITIQFPNRYRRVCDEYAPIIEKTMIASARATAYRSFEVAGACVEDVAKQLEDGTLRDPAGAGRNVATIGGIMTDKMLLLDNRPTQISEHRSADDVMRGLAGAGFIEGSATEETNTDA